MNPKTEKVYEEGDIITRDHLGATLQHIANSSDPLQLFYRGNYFLLIFLNYFILF